MKINLIVIKTQNVEISKSFYELLGINFQKEKHGNGPIHYSSNIDGVIFEIYPTKEENIANLRIGLTIENIDLTCELLTKNGHSIISEPRKTDFGYTAVIIDPSGNKVEIKNQD